MPDCSQRCSAVVVRFLRARFGILLQGYIDDFLFQAVSVADAVTHTHIAIVVFHCLGFEVNFSKSILSPSQKIEHLGFNWDSVDMTVALPARKIHKMSSWASAVLATGGCTKKELRSFLGTAESTRPAAEEGALHYRHLQALQRSARSEPGARFLSLTRGARMDLLWWRDTLSSRCQAPLRRGPFTLDLTTDASGLWGWGGSLFPGVPAGPLDTGAGFLAHQCQRASSRDELHQGHDETRRLCPAQHGQHDSCCLLQPTGRHKEPYPQSASTESMGVCACHGGLASSYLAAQRAQSAVGLPLERKASHMGLLPGPSGRGQPVDQMVPARGGLLREQKLPCAATILHPLPRQTGREERRLLGPQVARHHLCLSSSAPDPNGTGQDPLGWYQGHHGGTPLDHSQVVGPVGGGSATTSSPPWQSPSDPSPPPGPSPSKPGFSGGLPRGAKEHPLLSEDAQKLMDSDVRQSTDKVYKGRQETFRLYCHDIGCEPETAPLAVVSNFLALLTTSLGYSYQTVCGYRSAISRIHMGRVKYRANSVEKPLGCLDAHCDYMGLGEKSCVQLLAVDQ